MQILIYLLQFSPRRAHRNQEILITRPVKFTTPLKATVIVPIISFAEIPNSEPQSIPSHFLLLHGLVYNGDSLNEPRYPAIALANF